VNDHDRLRVLQFSPEWIELGIVTPQEVDRLNRAYASGDDKNTEHYRWGAFRQYVQSHRPLPADMAEALYELGGRDPDPSAGSAMMHAIVELPECPDVVLTKAAAYGTPSLVRLAERTRLLSCAPAGGLTPNGMDRCIAGRDSTLQRQLLDRGVLSVEQTRRLADEGASRAVRNLARSLSRRTDR
jgi:hypothetical protein